MKKLLRISTLFLLIAALLCSFSLLALAESDDAVSKSEESVTDGEPILTIGALSDDSTEEPDKEDESSDITDSAVLTIGAMDDTETTGEETESTSYTEPIQFVLFKKFSKLDMKEWLMFVILLAVLIAGIIVLSVVSAKKAGSDTANISVNKNLTKVLVVGAISLSLSFVLSYVKLFSMPYGGSVTLCSMLPVMVYAAWVGPKYGFLAAFAYGLLQLIQGTYVGIHWASILLDYVLAFSALGLTSLFAKNEKLLPVGILIAGFARMICSILSGYLIFAEYAPEGMNPLDYAILYNLLTVGVDTIICVVVYMIPPVRKAFNKAKAASFGE